MNDCEESKLPIHKRLKIIDSIKKSQRKKWLQLKWLHNELMPPERHFYMHQLIMQIRIQKIRLERLKQSIRKNNE